MEKDGRETANVFAVFEGDFVLFKVLFALGLNGEKDFQFSIFVVSYGFAAEVFTPPLDEIFGMRTAERAAEG